MKISLGTKIFLAFCLILATFSAVSIYGVGQFHAVGDQLNTLNRGLLPLSRVISEMEILQESARRSTISILRFDNIYRQRTLLTSTRQSFRRNMLARLQQAQTIIHRIDLGDLLSQDRLFLDEIRSRLDMIRDRTDDFDKALDTVIQSIDVVRMELSKEPEPQPPADRPPVREAPKEPARELPKEPSKEAPAVKDASRELPKEPSKDASKEASKEASKDASKELSKEPAAEGEPPPAVAEPETPPAEEAAAEGEEAAAAEGGARADTEPMETAESLGLSDALIAPGQKLAREVRMLQRTFKNKITSKLLALERDENEASGVILWMTIVAMGLGVAGALLALLTLRPIRRMAEAARRISRGDFSYTVDVRTTDEFGFLAQEFNRMAKSLALREEERARHQVQLEKINRELRQSGIDLSLMKLYNEHIIRSIQNAIVVADSLGVVTTLNPSAVSLFRLDAEKTIGQRILELPIAKRLPGLADSWHRVLLSKERIAFEGVEYDAADGVPLLVDVYICPLLGHDGNVQGVLFVGEDVSEKVRTKQALIQSERMATIGRMSALVAHEIRNPLSSIGLNAEMLQDEMCAHLPEECRDEVNQLLGSISREVERLAEVTEEYLKFARLPKPQFVLEPLNELVEGILRFVEEEYRLAKIEIQTKLDPAVCAVRADEGQMRQAFLNLLRNALEAMPQGGVLTITTESLGERVRISISDTGCGMEKDVLERVFDPFFSTKDSGTGLGLSLTQHIIHEHGGSIFCQSLPQKGSTFVVELPIESQGRRTA